MTILPTVLPFGALKCPAPGCTEGKIRVHVSPRTWDSPASEEVCDSPTCGWAGCHESRECEACRGTGLAICSFCAEEIAVELDAENRLTCAPCRDERIHHLTP